MASGKLKFAGVGARDVYNITASFTFDGHVMIAGRVEGRETEHAETVFFTPSGDEWVPVPGAPTFPALQDPCITFVDDELVFGGVQFPIKIPGGENIWRMQFYRGKTLAGLKHFFEGPDKMKDIRLKQLSDGRIGVLTRPQGGRGGRGKVGFMTVDRLEALTVEQMEAAPLFEHLFLPDEWGGANEAHVLANGNLGVLGHMAYFDEKEHRHYYPMVFSVDLKTGLATSPKIIAQRKDFPAGESKRADLADVLFSGGIVRHGDNTATLYAGLSDAEAGWVRIPDPFRSFEQRR